MIEVSGEGGAYAEDAGHGTSATPEKPTGAVNGDTILAAIAIELTGADVALAGFTSLGARTEQVNGTPFQVALFRGEEDGSPDPALTWEDGEARSWSSLMVTLHGVKAGEEIEFVTALASATKTAVVRGPSGETVDDGAQLVWMSINREDIDLKAPPEGMVHGFDTGGNALKIETQEDAGASGDKDGELEAAAWNIGALVGLKPEPAPVSTEAPVLSGTVKVGHKLAVSDGEWTGAEGDFSYQWEVSPDGETSWVPLPGAEAAEYTVSKREDGRYLRCVVTATNTGGSTEAPSNATATAVAVLQIFSGGVLLPVKPVSKVGEDLIRKPITIFDGIRLGAYPADPGENDAAIQSAEGAVTEVPDPAGTARTVLKLHVSDDDVAPVTPTENPRAQLSSQHAIRPGDEILCHNEFYLPNDFPDLSVSQGGVDINDQWVALMAIYGPPFAGTGTWGVEVTNLGLVWQRNETYGFDIPWRMPIVTGRWVTVLSRIFFAEEGWVDMWVDGERVTFFPDAVHNPNEIAPTKRLEMETMDTSNNGGPNVAKIANYRKVGMFDALDIYFRTFLLKAA